MPQQMIGLHDMVDQRDYFRISLITAEKARNMRMALEPPADLIRKINDLVEQAVKSGHTSVTNHSIDITKYRIFPASNLTKMLLEAGYHGVYVTEDVKLIGDASTYLTISFSWTPEPHFPRD